MQTETKQTADFCFQNILRPHHCTASQPRGPRLQTS